MAGKKEFEKNTDYIKRVQNRHEKIKEYTIEAIEYYKAKYLKENKIWSNVSLGQYDSESETFELLTEKLGKIIVPVPISGAETFKENFDSGKLKVRNEKIILKDEKWQIAFAEIHDPSTNKIFTYDNKMDLDYDPQSQFAFKFDPININLESGAGSQQKIDEYDVDVNIPRSGTKNRNAIAVVIGNQKYRKKEVPNVEYAVRDANVIKKHLINTLGYQEGNIIFVTNASQADFNSIFGTEKNYRGKLYNWVKSEKSDVFIYYSGHGAPNIETRKGYFVPVDCDPTLVALNGYSLDTFYTNLSKIPYKSLTVVIDACFSGTSEGGSLLQNISPVFASINNPAMVKKNTVIFTSAKGNQVSSWYPAMKHSLFTYYFLKGLHGMADKNKDKRLMVSELGKYLMENIPYAARRLNNREQTPQIIGDIERVIVRY